MMDAIKKPAPLLKMEHFEGKENIVDETERQQLTDLKERIQSCKIDLKEVLAPPPVAMRIASLGDPMTLFTKGNFSIVTGAAKSRKSFLISMLMAAAVRGRFQDHFICEGEGTNIVFDTEQSRYKAQQIGKRICNLSEKVNPSNLEVYSLRTLDPSQRLELIDNVLATTQNLNFVAIDGIIDLENDPILEAKQAQNIVMKLMQWTEIYNIHIVCVLHYNKTVATLLGHLGSFSHRKADAVVEVSKSKDDENISLVKALDCREKEFMPFAFSVDPSAMPYILKDYVIEKPSKEKKAAGEQKPKGISPISVEPQTHIDILNHVFNAEKEQGYNDLWRNIKNAIEKITGQTIGDNKAKDFVSHYLTNQNVIRTEMPKKKAVYNMAGQKAIDF
jgi:hypothetical protein